MKITEDQLKIWSSAPSPTEMQRIKNTRSIIEDIIKRKLPIDQLKRSYGLSNFDYEVYLQGSYANSTNVRYDSDVDIVVQLNSVFAYDKSQLPELEKILYDTAYNNSQYHFKQFKEDIYNALLSELTSSQVHFSDKCINVDKNTNRVDADVVPCFQYRLYKKFISYDNQTYVEGMRFFDTSNDKEIINFPKLHLKNCESKNVDTQGKFKDMVRIYKNMRNNLIEKKLLGEDIAPSYFIENLLYNCSSPCFDGSYGNCMIGTLQFILDAIQTGRISGFVCANEQDNLISLKTWNIENLSIFLNQIASYYLGQLSV